MKASEIRVSYLNDNPEKIIITDSQTVYNLIKKYWDLNKIELQEEVKIVLLDEVNIVIGIFDLSKRGLSESAVDVKLALSVALKELSSNIILVHNHPKGDLNPSKVDMRMTNILKNACDVVDIKLIDHLIISKKSYFSFKDRSYL